jgi:hypothetical protein
MFFKRSEQKAIDSLKDVASFGLGPQPEPSEMLSIIEKVEGQYPQNNSAELEYWLGIAWRNYTAWFVRGDDRKAYLEKAITHLERAYEIEKAHSGASLTDYADVLGILLVEESTVRNLQRGIALLESVFQNTREYDPCLCAYAEAIYKVGEYQKAADIALELHCRAKQSKEWKGSIPPAPMRIAAKSYRAEIKELKSERRFRDALSISEKLVQTDFVTTNDLKIHRKLQESLDADSK